MSCNSVFVIGPTAVGKTALGVRLAHRFGGEVLSADSRQVYKGLDIGSGKDLKEYDVPAEGGTVRVPHHLIDVCALETEFSLFDFQEAFYAAFADVRSRRRLPVCVGGTGLYIDSVLRKYDMVPVPKNPVMEAELRGKSVAELEAILIAEKEKLHNTTEFGDKERLIKAIAINRFNKSAACAETRASLARPDVRPLVIGTTLPRPVVRERIRRRLSERMDEGLVEEVEGLHALGASWRRLESLGLEYRFVSAYLQGSIATKEELLELLGRAIGQFAKRQETWFRGMERKGVEIRWLPQTPDLRARFRAACELVEAHVFG